ncbi:hypothetical protein AUC60_14120 [Pseudomonas caspiana]|uniref:Uncharacterized protein n=1 Tax=Pseudomonas caspiana TaxID=1451454 RepID=A0A1Y3P320_9PSED|nr:hypothetical protein AUC60_14120 [Pseudomonas caspiana]
MVSSGWLRAYLMVWALRIWVMPAQILCQGNLPHKGANCMPVPRVGFYAPNARYFGIKNGYLKIWCTLMMLDIVRKVFFGASMIGCTITG